MANEITASAGLSYEDDESDRVSMGVTDALFDIAAKEYIRGKLTVGTTEEAIPLGDVTDPGWSFFRNVSAAGTVSVRVATAGAPFAELQPGEFALLRLGSGASAPYAIASVAGVKLEYMILDT